MEHLVGRLSEILARLWRITRQQVGRPNGWVLPLALAPVCFGFLVAGSPVASDVGVFLSTCLAAIVGCLFWQVYVGLWRGDVAWMKGPGAVPRALLWCAALWLLAIAILAPISTHFYDARWVEVRTGIANSAGGGGALRTSWEFTGLYLWQTADVIPGLGVTDTLSLSQPVEYDDWKLGLMLLLYKAAVLLPVIAAYRGVWRSRHIDS